jgi:hypothetical protein
MEQLAQNNARWYRVSMQQMRYFPIKRSEAEFMIATKMAQEVPYLPFSRPDLYAAYKVVHQAIENAKSITK